VDQFLYDWQTLIAGVLAILAAGGTIWATIKSANREIAVAQKQIETTIQLEQDRGAKENIAFLAMLEAAMVRVIDETPLARGAVMTSIDTATVRACLTKGGFDELRGGCLRLGSPLTGEFLDLEREIDTFALSLWDTNLGLKQLDSIEAKAIKLRNKTVGMGIELVDAAAHLEPPEGR
jgi:hypothetical protein